MTSVEIAASFSSLVGMSQAKLTGMSNSQLATAVNVATLAKGKNLPGASTVLDVLRKEQARRKGSGGGDNTKLYLLGAAGLAAGWFFFVRKG
jgi:hypothetical protein